MTWSAKLSGHPDSVVRGPTVESMLKEFVKMLKHNNITASLEYNGSASVGPTVTELKKELESDEDSRPA